MKKTKPTPPRFLNLKLNTEECEKVQALFSEKALVLPPVILYRWRGGGPRRYFTYDSTGRITFFNSSSAIQNETEKTPEPVLKWYGMHGYERANEIRNEKGDYGTFFHIQSTIFDRTRKYDLRDPAAIVEKYCKVEKIDVDEKKWADLLWHDMVAWAEFCHAFHVQPVAIEIPLCAFELGVATVLDRLVIMDHPDDLVKSGKNKGKAKKGKTRRIRAIIDLKSPRKPGGEHNAMQLAIQSHLVVENGLWYEKKSFQPDEVYNWSPKDWRTNPAWNLTRQTGKVTPHEAKLAIDLANIRLGEEPNFTARPTKVLKYGESTADSFEVLSAEKIIAEQAEANAKKQSRGTKK